MMFRKKEKDSDQKSWFALILLSVLFYGSMLVLTLIAKDVRNARLPRVTAQRLGTQKFTYSVSNGAETRTTTALAIPKHLVDSDQVYSLLIIYNSETEETNCYVDKVSLTIDTSKENPDYYAVTDTSYTYTFFVTEGYEGLEDGDEVYYEGVYKK